jgi:PAS domain-containing protein
MDMAGEQKSTPDTAPGLPQELQSLVAQLHGAHIVIDADYRIVAANDAYREAFPVTGDIV